MTQLQIRRPAFRIDETVPFQWQPANPTFGIFGNAFTFIAISFERYIVTTMRQAIPLITDPTVAEEANAFLRQEAQHARAHRHHAKALITRYPGLADTLDQCSARFDQLLDLEPLEFHLAYIADLEATFTPLFKMVLDNRGPLFEGGDDRVGTMLLWHFVEEIEHRSSALIVQRHLNTDKWYRLKVARRVFEHVSSTFELILKGFADNVPLADSQIPIMSVNSLGADEVVTRLPVLRRRRRGLPPTMLQHVPTTSLVTMIWHLVLCQTPNHDPADEQLPAWADQWHAAYDTNDDVTTYTGAHL
jgi:predicted metal-dependent hydrolase